MKNILQLLPVLIFALAITNAFGQIPNSGFENWTTTGSYMDANSWSSENLLCTGAFHPITRVSDPYPATVGSYSMRIENNTAQLSNYCGYGFLWSLPSIYSYTKPAFPVTGHPTSLTGYYKWLPQNGDTMYINILLFQGGSQVSSGKFTSTVTASGWTSFNIPLPAYANADSGLIILAAYNADNTNYVPHGNSVLQVDNLNFDILITGVSDPGKTSKLSVYPNPFSSSTTLQTDKALDNATLIAYNSFGQQVKEIKNISGQTIILNRDNLPSGLYFLQLIEDTQSSDRAGKIITTEKLVITGN